MSKPPAKRDPNNPLASIPVIDAALYANVGRYAGAAVMTAFEMIGGTKRMAEWADENPEKFYTTVFSKVISAPRQVEVTGKVSIEDAVKALDLEEGTDYRDVTDATFEEDNG